MDAETIQSKYVESPNGHDGWVYLTCGTSAFDRLRCLILAEVNLKDIDIAKVTHVQVDVFQPLPARPSKLTGGIFVAGCMTLLIGFLAVFGVGIITVFEWLIGRRN